MNSSASRPDSDPAHPGNAEITELTPAQARARHHHGALLIDIRDPHEHLSGLADGAIAIARSELEADPTRRLPDRQTELLLICQRGQRSRALARQLRNHGYDHVASVTGGTVAWVEHGLPLQAPALEPQQRDFAERYARHLSLPEIGGDGQRRLASARVLLVGAGGLGSPAAFYLAAAGVGQLRLVDDDRVERSNLQRQILHTDADIGIAKALSASHRLQALNPAVAVEPVQERVRADNIERLLGDVDVVIDGSDNFATRYLLNDACVRFGKPLVYGAVQRFDGQVAVFDAGRQRGKAPCYRCLFPFPPEPGAAPACSEAGVLGVLPGVIGLLQATEALKLLLAIGEPLRGRLLRFDALSMRFHELALSVDPDCPVCAADAGPIELNDLPLACAR